MMSFDAEDTVDMIWVVDSETSKRYLYDRKTNKIVMTGEEMEKKNESST